MSRRLQWERGRFYFGWNGLVYWIHVSYGRVFTLTVGQKPPRRKERT